VWHFDPWSIFLDREKVRREWAKVYLFVGRSNALVACRHQIGRTEIRNVDVQCTSASSEVKLDRQSFLHLTSGFFFGYLPCPSSDCPMNEKKEIESPPETHSAPGHSNFAAQEFGKVQRRTCVLWPSPAGIPISTYQNPWFSESKQSTPRYRNRNLSYLRFFQSWWYCEMNTS
jgi:hypothetical protein